MAERPPLTVKGYVVFGAILFIFLCLAVVFFVSVRRRDRFETCALNLKMLGMAVAHVSPQDENEWDKVPTGSAFWVEHQKWHFYPIRPIRQQTMLCPVFKPVKGRTGTDYRGPARSLRLLAPDDPIGADRPANHAPTLGWNVLLRNGQVHHVREPDPLWKQAAETTAD